MLSTIESINSAVNNFIWGVPAMICIIGVGLYLTIRTNFLQIRKFPYAIKTTIGRMFRKKDASDGSLTPFQAVCTALAATVGTGNISGVAGAIAIGGPGAVFWMWISALLGMCTKFAEVTLAVHFRETNAQGDLVGGPMYYIKNGLKKHWHWLAYLFSAFGVLTVFGTGNATQVNTITTAVDSALINFHLISDQSVSTLNLIIGIVITILVGLILLGGIKRIGSVTEKLVPFMALFYILLALGVIIMNFRNIPHVFYSIIYGAFRPRAVTGGVVGSFFLSMKKGVSRGIFSNEAGLGSAPIAAAAAQTKEPVRQGLVTMTGTFVDTVCICTLTGLTVMTSGAYEYSQANGLEGVEVTAAAFGNGLPWAYSAGTFVLMTALAFFAFTTILGWDYYAERSLEYLTDNMKAVMVYRWIYILAVLIGPFLTVSAVWTIANILNAFMAIPNLIALLALNGVIVAETRSYFNRLHAGEIREFAPKEKKRK